MKVWMGRNNPWIGLILMLLGVLFAILIALPAELFGKYTLARITDAKYGNMASVMIYYDFQIEGELYSKKKKLMKFDTTGAIGSFFVLKVVPGYPGFNTVKRDCPLEGLEYGELYESIDCDDFLTF